MNKNTLGNLIGAAILVAYVGISYLLYNPSTKIDSSSKLNENIIPELTIFPENVVGNIEIYNNSSDSIFLLWASDEGFETGLRSTAFLIDTIPGMLGSGSLITPLYNIMDEKDEFYKYLFAINIKDDFTKKSNWHELKGDKVKAFPFMKSGLPLEGGVLIGYLTFKNDNKFETLPYADKLKYNADKLKYKPTIVERFWSIGNPEGYIGVMSELDFIRTEGLGDSTYVFRGIAPPGLSGAPIFNDRGEVIAMVILYDAEKQEVYALPSYLF